MRIAICYRGKNFDLYDYRNCIENNINYLIKPLLLNNEIDIFCILYDSYLSNNLLNDYKPVKYHILDKNDHYNGNQWQRQIIFHKISVDLIKDYEISNNIKYDLIINLRYDLYFKVKINEWNIDYNKIMLPFKHWPSSGGHCDDNIFIIPRKYLEDFYYAVCELEKYNKMTHELNSYIDNNNIKYIYELTNDDEKNLIKFKLYKIFHHPDLSGDEIFYSKIFHHSDLSCYEIFYSKIIKYIIKLSTYLNIFKKFIKV